MTIRMATLHKKITLYFNGQSVEVPIVPFLSGKKKIELEAIIPKYVGMSDAELKKELEIINKTIENQNDLIEKIKEETSSPPVEGWHSERNDGVVNEEVVNDEGTATPEQESHQSKILYNRNINSSYKVFEIVEKSFSKVNDKSDLDAQIQIISQLVGKAQIDKHKDFINIDYLKAMIDYNKIKNEALADAIKTDNSSDFWLSQDVLFIGEIANSFRKLII